VLREYFADLGVPVHLRDILPDRSPLERLASAAVADACNLTNPRAADKDSLLGICEEAW
jgi:alcohol dehydrogenase